MFLALARHIPRNRKVHNLELTIQFSYKRYVGIGHHELAPSRMDRLHRLGQGSLVRFTEAVSRVVSEK